MGILDIPNEILLSIVGDLSIKDLSHLLLTCRRLRWLLTPRLQTLGLQDVGKLTALEWAAERGHASLAELAIMNGADVEGPNPLLYEHGRAPLHSAAMNNHHKVMRILIKHKARVSARTVSHSRWDGFTPLHYAAFYNCEEATLLLLKEGAAMMSGADPINSPPFIVARRGSVASMRAFVEAGFDLTTRARDGHTILHSAVGKTAMMGYLLGHQKVKKTVNAQDLFGKTLLHHSMKGRDVKLLLRQGADMSVRDNGGDTPAHFSATRCSYRNLRAFIDAGFDIRTTGSLGRTVLHMAVQSSILLVVEYILLNAGGKSIIDAQDSDGLTALGLAVERCQHYGLQDGMKFVDILEQHGADQEVRARDGVKLADRIREFRSWIPIHS